jgi:Tol biopolymer transport system component
MRNIPGLDSSLRVTGWSTDGKSLYVSSSRSEQTAQVYKVDIATGKMEPWRTFGAGVGAGITETGAPMFSADGSAYAYVYVQILSNAYVVTGLK